MTRTGFATALAAGLVQLGCASSSSAAPAPDEPVLVAPTELAQLKADAARVGPLAARIAALEGEKAALTEQLHVAQQRLGLEPFRPSTLEARDGQLKLPEANRLDTEGGKAKKTSLARALAETHAGALIAYWATWCKPCTAPDELARLKRLKAELATQGADVLFFAIDELPKVMADARASTWLYPLWQRDQGHLDMLPEAIVRNGGVDLPLMLIVSKTGRIAWVHKGALDDQAVTEIVTAVIRGR